MSVSLSTDGCLYRTDLCVGQTFDCVKSFAAQSLDDAKEFLVKAREDIQEFVEKEPLATVALVLAAVSAIFAFTIALPLILSLVITVPLAMFVYANVEAICQNEDQFYQNLVAQCKCDE